MCDFEELSIKFGAGGRRTRKTMPKCAVLRCGNWASAGGLEAFTQLLGALSVSTGMAFVLVQHDPAHESQLAPILSRTTTMPLQQINDGMAIEPNSIYVIPPNATLTMAGGALHLAPRSPDHALHLLGSGPQSRILGLLWTKVSQLKL